MGIADAGDRDCRRQENLEILLSETDVQMKGNRAFGGRFPLAVDVSVIGSEAGNDLHLDPPRLPAVEEHFRPLLLFIPGVILGN